MKHIAKIGLIALATASLGLADSWSGQLVAARCTQEPNASKAQPLEGCAPTSQTTVFAIQTPDGKLYKLDDVGNRKAAAALKENPLRKDDPLGLSVTVSGTFDGQTLKVDSLDVTDRPQ